MKKLHKDFPYFNTFPIEFQFDKYKHYKKSEYNGKYLDNQNYITLVLSVNTLKDMHKDILSFNSDELKKSLIEESIELLIELGEIIQLFYENGAHLDSEELIDLTEEHLEISKILTELYNRKSGVSWVINHMRFSTLLFYSNQIIVLAKYMKSRGCDDLIHAKDIQHLQDFIYHNNSKILKFLQNEIQMDIEQYGQNKQ